jgi:photosystem II stability/assembly factor-like uncharacterized protein
VTSWAKGLAWTVVCVSLWHNVSFAQQNSLDRWVGVGPDFGGIYALQYDPFNKRTLFAGAFYGGVYRSTDAGLSWSHLDSPFSSENVQSIAFDAAIAGRVYVSTFQGGVYQSNDYGASWVQLNNGLTNINVLSLTIDPFDSNTLFAVTPSANFLSNDAGASWRETAKGLPANAALFHPTQQGVIYLALTSNGVACSTDGGATFSTFNTGMGNASVISFSYDQSTQYLYAASFKGAFRIAAGASMWENITNNLPAGTINQVIHDSNQPSGPRLLAVTATGLYQMPDQGSQSWQLIGYFPSRILLIQPDDGVYYVATYTQGLLVSLNGTYDWKPLNKGLQNLFIGAMASPRFSDGIAIYAGSDHGIYTINGLSPSWVPSSNFFETIFEITPHPTDSQTVFAGTERSGVWKSQDQGNTWQRKSKGMQSPQVASIERSPVAPSTLWAGALAGLYFSRDNGASWTPATQVPITSIRAVAVDPARSGVVLAGTSDGQVWASYDDGNLFRRVQGLPTAAVSQLKITSVNGFPVIYALVGGQLYVSTDDTFSWFSVTSTITATVYSADVDPSNSSILYIATNNGLFKTTDGGVSWTISGNGMQEPFVLSVAIDPFDPVTVFAATSAGVYRSADAANTWQSISGSLPAGPVDRLEYDPTTPGRIYALVRGLGVYASEDNGDDWSQRNNGLPFSEAISVSADPIQPGTIYAGTNLQGIFLSSDGGVDWTASDQGMGMLVRGIVIDTLNPSTIYAGSLYGGMFKSSDGGDSWTNIGLTGTPIFKTAIDPAQPNNVFAATAVGVARSNDAGNKWTFLGQRSAYVNCMTSDPRNRNVIYICSQNNVFRSSDGGVVWDTLSDGLPGGVVNGMAVDGTTGDLYAIIDPSYIYKRPADTGLWQIVDDFSWSQKKLVSIAADPVSGAVWAAIESGGILASFDYGKTWSIKGIGLTGVHLTKLMKDPFLRNTLYGISSDSGVLTSVDGGEVWQQANVGLPTNSVSAIAGDQNNSGVVFVATDQGFFKSMDYGATWTRMGNGFGTAIVSVLMVDQVDSNTLYAGGLSLGIYKSIDQGKSWISSFAGLNSADIAALAPGPGPGIIFAGTLGSGFQKTTDGGASWSGGNFGETIQVAQTIAIDPKNPSTIYAGTATVGVIKSTDGGDTWKLMDKGLDNLAIFSMAIDSINTNTIYVGTYNSGVYVSDDGAGTWTHLTTNGLFVPFVTSLAVDPIDHNKVYAGTEGGGVFQYNRIGK